MNRIHRVHNHPLDAPCAEREVLGDGLRGACLNDDGTSAFPPVAHDPRVDEENLRRELAEDRVIRSGSLQGWWRIVSAGDLAELLPKAKEYGSNSLRELGKKMYQLGEQAHSPNRADFPAEEEYLELGCWVNLVQKVERWTDSVMRGERPSDDTLKDIVIYAQMARRIREVGSWPGPVE